MVDGTKEKQNEQARAFQLSSVFQLIFNGLIGIWCPIYFNV